MGLSLTEWSELHKIDKRVRRSDPQLASLLTLFSRLAVVEPMPRHERLCVGACGFRALLLMMTTAGQMINSVAGAIRRASGCTRRCGPAAARRLAGWSRRRRGAAGWHAGSQPGQFPLGHSRGSG